MKIQFFTLSKNIALCIALLLVSNILNAQAYFPEMDVEDLEGKSFVIPKELNNKPTILFVVYSEKAEANLYSWLKPVYANFVDKSTLAAQFYDCDVHLLLMFTGAKKAAKEGAVKRIKKEGDPGLFPYLLFYKGDLKTYKDDLNLSKKEDIYIYVIDKEGNISFSASGAFKEKTLEAIQDVLVE